MPGKPYLARKAAAQKGLTGITDQEYQDIREAARVWAERRRRVRLSKGLHTCVKTDTPYYTSEIWP